MCVRVKCKRCNKATYAGCGAHVEQVLRGVAASDRCVCDAAQAKAAPRKWWQF